MKKLIKCVFSPLAILLPCLTQAKGLKSTDFMHQTQPRWLGGQLLKVLIRSVSSFSSEGGRLCKMVSPDMVTSWQLAWASLAGIASKPRAEWPEHQLDSWLKSWVQAFLPHVTVMLCNYNNQKMSQVVLFIWDKCVNYSLIER